MGDHSFYSVVLKKMTVLLSTGLAWPDWVAVAGLNFSRKPGTNFLHNPEYGTDGRGRGRKRQDLMLLRQRHRHSLVEGATRDSSRTVGWAELGADEGGGGGDCSSIHAIVGDDESAAATESLPKRRRRSERRVS